MDIEIKGIKDVIIAIEDMVGTANLVQAVNQSCDLVVADAKRNAPKRTGELRRSIQSKTEVGAGTIEGIIFSPLEYAPYVEYGTGLFAEGGNGRKDVPWHYEDERGVWHSTKGQHPQPYLRPAFNANRDNIIRKIKEGLK